MTEPSMHYADQLLSFLEHGFPGPKIEVWVKCNRFATFEVVSKISYLDLPCSKVCTKFSAADVTANKHLELHTEHFHYFKGILN